MMMQQFFKLDQTTLRHIRRALLWPLLAFVGMATLFGIGAILGIWHDYSPHVIGTMFALAAYVALIMASLSGMTHPRWSWVILAGIALQTLALAVILWLIWGPPLTRDNEDVVAQALGLILVWAVALPLTAHVAQMELRQPFAPLRWATIVLLAAAAAMATLALIFLIESAAYYQLMAILLLLTAGSGIALRLIYHHQQHDKPPAETVAHQLTIICPRCQLSQTLTTGLSRCGQCRLKFTIDIEEPRCPQCSYLLFRLTEPRCPECGATLSQSEIIPAPASTDTQPSPPAP